MLLQEKQEQLGKVVTQMRAINDAAKDRAFTAEEDEKYKKLEGDCDKLEGEVRSLQEKVKREAKLAEREAHLATAPPPATKPTPGSHKEEGRASDGAAGAHPYAKFLRHLSPVRQTREYQEAFELALSQNFDAANKRVDSLQVGLFTKGGVLQPPTEWLAELLKNIDDATFIRQYARKFRLEKAASLGVPKLDTDIDDADWTPELGTGSQGDFAFGSRELRPHPMAKSVKVSKTLPRVSAMPIDQFVRERLQYKCGITDEKAFLTADGVQKPLGIFTASSLGVDTTRDVSTFNTATEIHPDNLHEAKGSLKPQYLAGARWIFHRNAVTKIRQLKDGNGQYLWIPGLSGSNPSTILELPYDQSEYAPNTFTSGLYVGALWVPQFYWIADALDLTIQFVDQLYAATNQDGYIARRESDGMPVLAEAFARVKLG
jgi:HK97 family phage major capsid protein